MISATLAINEETEKRRVAGLPVLPLGFGEAGLPVHDGLRRVMSQFAGHASYGPVAGIEELRVSAADYWARRRLPTDPDRVVAGPGTKPLLYAVLHAVGGAVAVPRPSWVSYAAQAALLGTSAIGVPTLPGEGGVPDPGRLAATVARAARDQRPLRAVVLTLPDNPTGTLASPATVREVCEVAEQHDLWIISDEIYRDLLHDDQEPFLSPAEAAPERTITTTGLSKSLALGGWRVGVARFPDTAAGGALVRTVAGIGSEIWSTPAQPIQHAAAWAFTEPDCLRERVARSRHLHSRVNHAVAAQLQAAGAVVPTPQGGFYLYPDLESLRDQLGAAHDITTGPGLATVLLDGPGIATLPAAAFGEPAEALRLRLATSLLYGSTTEKREQALRSDDPASLPWIAEALDTLRAGLCWLTNST